MPAYGVMACRRTTLLLAKSAIAGVKVAAALYGGIVYFRRTEGTFADVI